MCEIINVINICANIYLTNLFLSGSFLTYGIKVLKYQQNRGYQFNPMEVTFPRLTKCNFYKYGSSGTIQHIDVMCILAQNVLNDKIYLFLWFWFFILAILSIMGFIYRIAFVMQITMKKTLLFNMFNITNNKQKMLVLANKFQVRNKLY